MPHFQFGTSSRVLGARYGVYGDEKEYGRKLSPLEEEARMRQFNAWGGLGKRWVDDILKICRSLNISAIVNFEQQGCVAAGGLRKLLSDGAMQELGIPMLNIEGRNLFMDAGEQKRFEDKLAIFVESAIKDKSIKR